MKPETLIKLSFSQTEERYKELRKFLDDNGFPYELKDGQIIVPITQNKRVIEKGGDNK